METETGLPELPEGQFWHVAQTTFDLLRTFNIPSYGRVLNSVSPGRPAIAIMEKFDVVVKSPWWSFKGDKGVTRHIIVEVSGVHTPEGVALRNWIDVTPQAIAYSAGLIFKGRVVREKAKDRLRARKEKASPLFGSYPPLTLEGK